MSDTTVKIFALLGAVFAATIIALVIGYAWDTAISPLIGIVRDKLKERYIRRAVKRGIREIRIEETKTRKGNVK